MRGRSSTLVLITPLHFGFLWGVLEHLWTCYVLQYFLDSGEYL